MVILNGVLMVVWTDSCCTALHTAVLHVVVADIEAALVETVGIEAAAGSYFEIRPALAATRLLKY